MNSTTEASSPRGPSDFERALPKEDPTQAVFEPHGRSALKQLDPYLARGHFLSADRRVDYAARLGEVTVPILMVAGDGDIISSAASRRMECPQRKHRAAPARMPAPPG